MANLCLIDEALTPDSSRFWDAGGLSMWGIRSRPTTSNSCAIIWKALDWNKTAPGPVLPERIVDKTAAKYAEALRLLTGTDINTE